MNNLNKFFTLISTISVIFILSVVFHKIWIIAQRAAIRSCVSSVAGDIVENSDHIDSFAQSRENWYVLTDSQAKLILSDERIKFDNCSLIKSQPQDMNEKNIKIAVRKNNEYGFRVMAWSKGFDNISGTEDDIVTPYNEEVPQ